MINAGSNLGRADYLITLLGMQLLGDVGSWPCNVLEPRSKARFLGSNYEVS